MSPANTSDAYIYISSSDTNEMFNGLFASCYMSGGFMAIEEVTVTAGVTYTRIADVNNTAKVLYRPLH